MLDRVYLNDSIKMKYYKQGLVTHSMKANIYGCEVNFPVINYILNI